MEILGLLLPIFAIIGTGVIFAHFKLLPDSAGDALIQFSFWVAIPALLFRILAEESLDRLLDAAFYVSFGGAIVGLFVIVFLCARIWLHKPLGEATILAYMSIGSNTAFIALPVLHALFGHRAVLPAALATFILIFAVLTTSVLLERAQEAEDRKDSTLLAGVRHAFLNPLVVATFLGVAYAATGWPLPELAKQYLGFLGAAVTPCALFAIGMSIKLEDMRLGAVTIIVISVLSLVVFPATVLLLALLVDLDPILAIAAVVCAAVPVGKTAFVLASQFRQSEHLVAAAISISSAASILTLLAWLYLLARIYPGTLVT